MASIYDGIESSSDQESLSPAPPEEHTHHDAMAKAEQIISDLISVSDNYFSLSFSQLSSSEKPR